MGHRAGAWSISHGNQTRFSVRVLPIPQEQLSIVVLDGVACKGVCVHHKYVSYEAIVYLKYLINSIIQPPVLAFETVVWDHAEV